jgi:hypothetical protein
MTLFRMVFDFPAPSGKIRVCPKSPYTSHKQLPGLKKWLIEYKQRLRQVKQDLNARPYDSLA